MMFGLSCPLNSNIQILSCWNDIYSLYIFSLYSGRKDEDYLNRGPGVGGVLLRFLVQTLTGHGQMIIRVTSCIEVCTADDVVMIAKATGTKYVALSNWGCYWIPFLFFFLKSLDTPLESKTSKSTLASLQWYSWWVRSAFLKITVNLSGEQQPYVWLSLPKDISPRGLLVIPNILSEG